MTKMKIINKISIKIKITLGSLNNFYHNTIINYNLISLQSILCIKIQNKTPTLLNSPNKLLINYSN